MQSILIVGIIVFTDFVFGEIATKIRLPKVIEKISGTITKY